MGAIWYTLSALGGTGSCAGNTSYMACLVDDNKLSESPHGSWIGLVTVNIKINGAILKWVCVALSNSIPTLLSFISIAILFRFYSGGSK